MPLGLGGHRQGADLGQVVPTELKRTAPDHPASGGIETDREVAQVIVELGQGSWQKFAALAENFEQTVDGPHVRYAGRAYHEVGLVAKLAPKAREM